jgi:uncharacterized protein (DUF2141 family)
MMARLLLALGFCAVLLSAEETSTLTIQVPNLRNTRGEVRAAIFQPDSGFPKKLEAAYRRAVATMEGNEARIVFELLEPGDYAVVVVHDENGNGKLDTNAFGIPKEGYGFSRNAKGRFGPPSFQAARITMGTSPQELTISLNY